MIINYKSVPIEKVAGKLDILTYFDSNLQGFSIKDRNNPMIRTTRELSDKDCKEVAAYWSKIESITNPPLPFPQLKNPMDIFISFSKDYWTSAVEACSIYSNLFKDMKPALTHVGVISFSELLKKEGSIRDKVDVDISYWGTNEIQRKFLKDLYEKS